MSANPSALIQARKDISDRYPEYLSHILIVQKPFSGLQRLFRKDCFVSGIAAFPPPPPPPHCVSLNRTFSQLFTSQSTIKYVFFRGENVRNSLISPEPPPLVLPRRSLLLAPLKRSDLLLDSLESVCFCRSSFSPSSREDTGGLLRSSPGSTNRLYTSVSNSLLSFLSILIHRALTPHELRTTPVLSLPHCSPLGWGSPLQAHTLSRALFSDVVLTICPDEDARCRVSARRDKTYSRSLFAYLDWNGSRPLQDAWRVRITTLT